MFVILAFTGLEHVVEIRFEGRREPHYECKLCGFNTEMAPMIEHLSGYKHRRAYIVSHFDHKILSFFFSCEYLHQVWSLNPPYGVTSNYLTESWWVRSTWIAIKVWATEKMWSRGACLHLLLCLFLSILISSEIRFSGLGSLSFVSIPMVLLNTV